MRQASSLLAAVLICAACGPATDSSGSYYEDVVYDESDLQRYRNVTFDDFGDVYYVNR